MAGVRADEGHVGDTEGFKKGYMGTKCFADFGEGDVHELLAYFERDNIKIIKARNENRPIIVNQL